MVIDASPKSGMEVFAVKEMVIKDDNRPLAMWRHLLLVSLGHGRSGAMDCTPAFWRRAPASTTCGVGARK